MGDAIGAHCAAKLETSRSTATLLRRSPRRPGALGRGQPLRTTRGCCHVATFGGGPHGFDPLDEAEHRRANGVVIGAITATIGIKNRFRVRPILQKRPRRLRPRQRSKSWCAGDVARNGNRPRRVICLCAATWAMLEQKQLTVITTMAKLVSRHRVSAATALARPSLVRHCRRRKVTYFSLRYCHL